MLKTQMRNPFLVINGVDARTGGYLGPSLRITDAARLARGMSLIEDDIGEPNGRNILADGERMLGPMEGVRADDLASAGWAVIFPHTERGSKAWRWQKEVYGAVEPLLKYRRDQATREHENLYREFLGANGYRIGETRQNFWGRMRVGHGPANPRKLPYYVMLVASPQEIPYQLQYQLDVEHAVGRIHFDTLDEYAQYAQNVIEAETNPQPGPRRAGFFAVENPDDIATHLSRKYLVEPLCETVHTHRRKLKHWQIEHALAGAATRDRLAQYLGADGPQLLFAACHGLGFPVGDSRLLDEQGALVCQDWRGPKSGAPPRDSYFAAEDLDPDADLRGRISCFYACHGTGTPKYDEIGAKRQQLPEAVAIAPHAFVSRLPQRMLGRKRGALAVIGHVNRVLASSFLRADHRNPGQFESSTECFESAVLALLAGRPVGYATEYFHRRYAALAAALLYETDECRPRARHSATRDEDMARMWANMTDARNYVIVGDPAVRLQKPGGGSPHRQSPNIGAGTGAGAGAGTSTGTDDPLQQFAEMQPLDPFEPPRDRDGDDSGEESPRDVKSPLELAPHQLWHETANMAMQALHTAMCSVTELDISTHTADTPAASPARSAHTRYSLSGDTKTSVPVYADGTIDEVLWRIHAQVVAQAMEHRRWLLDLVLERDPPNEVATENPNKLPEKQR